MEMNQWKSGPAFGLWFNRIIVNKLTETTLDSSDDVLNNVNGQCNQRIFVTVNERSAHVNRYFDLKGVFSRQHIAVPSTDSGQNS